MKLLTCVCHTTIGIGEHQTTHMYIVVHIYILNMLKHVLSTHMCMGKYSYTHSACTYRYVWIHMYTTYTHITSALIHIRSVLMIRSLCFSLYLSLSLCISLYIHMNVWDKKGRTQLFARVFSRSVCSTLLRSLQYM